MDKMRESFESSSIFTQYYSDEHEFSVDMYQNSFLQSDYIKFCEGYQAALADARKDQARYQYVIDWLESNVIATAAFTHARTKSEYDQAIDAAIKEQQ